MILALFGDIIKDSIDAALNKKMLYKVEVRPKHEINWTSMSILNFFQTGQLRENELSDFNWFLDRFEKNKLMKKNKANE